MIPLSLKATENWEWENGRWNIKDSAGEGHINSVYLQELSTVLNRPIQVCPHWYTPFTFTTYEGEGF